MLRVNLLACKKRNPFANPITNEDQSNLMHLMQFAKMLEEWKKLEGRN